MAQPHVSENGDILCWNGEVWNIHLPESDCALLIHIRSKRFSRAWTYVLHSCPYRANWSSQCKVRPDENDGIKLSATMSGIDDPSDIVQLLGTLEGP